VFYTTSTIDKPTSKQRIFVLLLAFLLATSVLLALNSGEHAHAATTISSSQRSANAAASTNSAVNYANSHWNWSYYDPNHHSIVPAGSGQNSFQCAEFVARALSTEGIIYGPKGNLGPNSAQTTYEKDKIGSRTWDLLWVGYAPPYDGLKQYLLDNGLAENIGNHISQASPGDVVIYPGDDGLGHTAILVKINGQYSLVDQHNVAEKNINYREYNSIDILHIW
jgi:CHAP domain